MIPISSAVPPHNIEAEQAILGTMLLSPTSIPIVTSEMEPGEFYKQAHREIYAVMLELSNSGQNVDLITVSERLRALFKLDLTGGAPYLAQLTSIVPSVYRVEGYCGIVKQKHKARCAIKLANKLSDDCFNCADTGLVFDQFGKDFFDLIADKSDKAKTFGDILPATLAEIEERCNSDDELIGVSTGFGELDRMISGLVPTDLIVVAGRPSMGKTSFALNIAQHVAINGGRVVFFSMEMSKGQLVERGLSTISNVNFSSIRKGLLNRSTWPMVKEAARLMSDKDLIIDDTPALSITQIRARSKMLHMKGKLGLVVVDYIGLATAVGENRTREVAIISAGLKALAKELEIPVIALSQLNRTLENRADKRPIMADLRESGAIEQDADTIIFPYRDEVYNKNDDNPAKGLAEIIIAKQRNGPTGTIDLGFDGSCVRFTNI